MWLERIAGGVLVPRELRKAREEKKEQRQEAEYRRIMDAVANLIANKGPMSARHLRTTYGGTTNVLAAGDTALRGALTKAVEVGELVEHPRSDGRGNDLHLP